MAEEEEAAGRSGDSAATPAATPADGDELGGSQRARARRGSGQPLTGAAKMQFHCFSFQIQRTTGDITARERGYKDLDRVVMVVS